MPCRLVFQRCLNKLESQNAETPLFLASSLFIQHQSSSSLQESKVRASLFSLGSWSSMGNKPGKQEREVVSPLPRDRQEILLKVAPPLDHAHLRWLARDLERVHGFTPGNCRAVTPPDHYAEYMRLQGWLDVNLDDPDLSHLFPGK